MKYYQIATLMPYSKPLVNQIQCAWKQWIHCTIADSNFNTPAAHFLSL